MLGGKSYFIYILANQSHSVLYVGVTGNLLNRVHEHKNRLHYGFTLKYFVNRLVYYEVYSNPLSVIEREKQLKKWKRRWKDKVITDFNPEWQDLYEEITNLY